MADNSLPPSTPEGEPVDPFGAMMTHVEPAMVSSGPLRGIRFCVKDNIGVAGQSFTAGHPLFSERTASSTAPEVLRILGLGADFVGMTRTDSGGFGVTTPGVRNPRHPDCTRLPAALPRPWWGWPILRWGQTPAEVCVFRLLAPACLDSSRHTAVYRRPASGPCAKLRSRRHTNARTSTSASCSRIAFAERTRTESTW